MNIDNLIDAYINNGGSVTHYPYDASREAKTVCHPFHRGYVAILSPSRDYKKYKELVKEQEVQRQIILSQASKNTD